MEYLYRITSVLFDINKNLDSILENTDYVGFFNSDDFSNVRKFLNVLHKIQ